MYAVASQTRRQWLQKDTISNGIEIFHSCVDVCLLVRASQEKNKE